MLGSLPLLLFGLWTGVWIDRLDRRKLLIGSQTAAILIVSFGIQPISALAIGFMADRIGTTNAMLLCGIALIVSALLMLGLRPGLRFWEAPRASEPVIASEAH